MKKILFVLMAIMISISMSEAAVAADTDNQGATVIKSEQQSVFKGLLYNVWSRLRALSPKSASHNRPRTAVTAGIRGAETTTSLIQPYWKDDKTEDPGYITELTKYTEAQQLVENGDLQEAARAFTAFIDEHENSDLRPNAQFALGISYGGLGQTRGAVDALQAFVNDNPKHPLVSDARAVIAQLQ